jgi:hypothetical protein
MRRFFIAEIAEAAETDTSLHLLCVLCDLCVEIFFCLCLLRVLGDLCARSLCFFFLSPARP